MTLVYLSESSLRRNESGITTSLESRCQKTELSGLARGLHESSDPEVSIDEILCRWRVCKAADHTRHQIANYNQVADANTEALDGNCSIEYDGSVGIGDLAQSEETGRTSIEVFGTTCLKV
jgi:hypothetical protein